MRLKKCLIIGFISILIFTISTNCFAVTSKKDSISKEIENKISNSVKNVVNNTNKIESSSNILNNNEKSISNKNSVERVTKKNIIENDVVNVEGNEIAEYKDILVNGNMFIANGEKVLLDNVKVDGDVIIFSNEAEITDSEIKGSIYTASKSIDILSSKLKSAYLAGNEINIESNTEVTRELKIAGNNVNIDCEVDKDTYIIAKMVNFGDNAKLIGKTIIEAESKEVSEKSKIEDLKFEETNFSDYDFTVDINNEDGNKIYLFEKITGFIALVVISIFVIFCSPKFSEVNESLRLRNFFADFFMGLLEIIAIFIISILLFVTGYGIGYGIIVLNLLIIFIILGKFVFIMSMAVRLSCNSENNSKTKAIFSVIALGIVFLLIDMVALLGTAGTIIDIIVNCILAITGFGALLRVIFASKKKIEINSNKKMNAKKEKAMENVVASNDNFEKKVENENVNNSEVIVEIQEAKSEINEIKEEIKEEKSEEKDETANEDIEEQKDDLEKKEEEDNNNKDE